MPTTFARAIADRKVTLFQWLVPIFAFLVLMFDGIDMNSLGQMAPRIFQEWGIAREQFGSAMSAALLGMAVGALCGGWLGDRFGRLVMLVVAAATFGLATIAAAYANDVWTMTLVRLIGGLGFGAAFPNSMALANDWMPARLKSYTVATLSLGVPAGTMVTGVIVPLMMPEFGWRGSFVIFGIASIVLAGIVALVLRESPAYLLSRGKAEAAHKSARRVLDDDVELIAEPHHGDDDQPEGKTGRIGVFHASNLRLNAGVGIGFACATAVVYGFTSWAPEMLTSRGFTLPQAQQVSFTIGLLSIIGGFSAGYLARRFGSRRVVLLAALGSGLLVAALALLVEGGAAAQMGAPASEGRRQAILWLIGAITGLTSVSIATIYVMMANGYQQSCRSSGIGFGMFMGRTGGILMAFFGGNLLSVGGGSFAWYFAAILLGAFGTLAAALIVDRHVMPPG